MPEDLITANINNFRLVLDDFMRRLAEDEVAERIWARDHTLWNDRPDEISNRLGWLDGPSKIKDKIPEISKFVEEIKSAGITDVLLMGMGGSSLAPEFFAGVDMDDKSGLRFHVIDSTHPGVVRGFSESLNPARTLFLASTKSGGTVETISLLKYFYNFARGRVGEGEIGNHFAAITDPGSGLEKIAGVHNFRKVFLNDPDIGGRFSALSYFGLVPAALSGWDISLLLDRAGQMSQSCGLPKENPGVYLGAILGCLASAGKNKLMPVVPKSIGLFGDWLEQLIAESTGKDGRGILPVICDNVGKSSDYSDDVYFLCLKMNNDNSRNDDFRKVGESGIPYIMINLENIYDMGSQFFLWEFAIAVAGHIMGIQPFNQPDVESAKKAAKVMIQTYGSDGDLPNIESHDIDGNIEVYADLRENSLSSYLNDFLSEAKDGNGSYIAVQAFLQPLEQIRRLLNEFKTKIEKTTGLPVTIGFGPRYLHSTGQLHKGGSGNGFFIQLLESYQPDLPIPDDFDSGDGGISFGTLIRAQCLGDREALIKAQRKIVTFGFNADTVTGLEKLIRLIRS